MDDLSRLRQQLKERRGNPPNAAGIRRVPFFAFGTRNAVVEYGPKADCFPSSNIGVDDDCIDELRGVAAEQLGIDYRELRHIDGQRTKYSLDGFFDADLFVFGTDQTKDVLDVLRIAGHSVLELFRPDSSDDQLVSGMQYSHVDRLKDGNMSCRTRRRMPDGTVATECCVPFEFETESSLFPDSDHVPYSEGLPRNLTLCPIEELPSVTSATLKEKKSSPVMFPIRRYDTWGTFPPKHSYFFHLSTIDLVYAVERALDRKYGLEGSYNLNKSSEDRVWKGLGPKHPANWRSAKLEDDVEAWELESGKTENYGDQLKRDRWLFWKWQSGSFAWTDILEAAIVKGFQIGWSTPGNDQKPGIEDDKYASKPKLQYLRRTARRYAEKYAKAVGLEIRKGR